MADEKTGGPLLVFGPDPQGIIWILRPDGRPLYRYCRHEPGAEPFLMEREGYWELLARLEPEFVGTVELDAVGEPPKKIILVVAVAPEDAEPIDDPRIKAMQAELAKAEMH
jgi:hypothetical protein